MAASYTGRQQNDTPHRPGRLGLCRLQPHTNPTQMRDETPINTPPGVTKPAHWLARWVAGLSATAWGCLAILTAYPVFTNALTFLSALSGNTGLAIWSLVNVLFWGTLLLAMVWAFRFRYRRERQSLLTEVAETSVAMGHPVAAPTVTGTRTLMHILLHFAWSVLFATGSLAYLSGAPSSPDIIVWGGRLLTLISLGLVGSLLIQVSWWGRSHWASAKFWLSWWVVTLACTLLGMPVAMRLVPL